MFDPKMVWRRLPFYLAIGLGIFLSACGETPVVREDSPGRNAMIDLPEPLVRGEMSLEETIRARRSVRAFSRSELSREELSQLLWAAQGITDPRRGLRAAPSAGATFPLETYAVTPAAVYRYHPAGHQLEQLTAADMRPDLAAAALDQDFVRTAPLILIFSAVEDRTTRRYGNRGRMYIHMEAGHAAQNVHLQAVAMGLGSVPVGAFRPEKIGELLGLPASETVLYLVPIGHPASSL